MSDLEQKLRAAMHAPVDGEDASPDALIAAVKRRHRRHNLRLAGLVALIAAAAAVPLAIAVRSVTSQPGPSITRHHGEALPAMMTGRPMPPGTNIGFLTTNNNAVFWYFTASRREERIVGLSSVPEGPTVSRVHGGWLVSGTRIRSFCPTYYCAGPPYPYYFVADGSIRATHLGSGIAIFGGVAASSPGEVWIVSHAHSSDNIATTSAAAQLVSATGQPLSPRYQLPAGYLVQRGVGRYLLLRQWPNINPSKPPASYPPLAYELWDPSTGHIVRRFNNVLATGPDQIVVSPKCRRCQVQILDVATGTTVTTPITGAQAAGLQQLVMSDDGSLLATQPQNGDVDVIRTATGAVTRIPGTDLNFDSWQTVEWQGASHELLIVAGPGRGPGSNPPTWVQVGYWRPGMTSLRLTTWRDHAQINAIGYG
jgi:hypothetical protein